VGTRAGSYLQKYANRVVTVGYTQPGWEKPFTEEQTL
jgi:hypothetical protein